MELVLSQIISEAEGGGQKTKILSEYDGYLIAAPRQNQIVMFVYIQSNRVFSITSWKQSINSIHDADFDVSNTLIMSIFSWVHAKVDQFYSKDSLVIFVNKAIKTSLSVLW